MNGAERFRRGVALVHQDDGESGAFREFGRDRAYFARARRLVAISVQRKAHHEAACFECLGAAHNLGDRRPLPRAAYDHARRRRDRSGRIADRQSYAALTVVDR